MEKISNTVDDFLLGKDTGNGKSSHVLIEV